MKKAIALLATLVVLTSTAFAQLAPTITASAETKWGVNLQEDNATGFENDLDVTVTIPLTSDSALTEGAHSSIALTGIELTIDLDDDDTDWDDTDDGDLSAKLLFGDAYVVIGDDEGLEFNYAATSVDYYDISSTSTGYAGVTFGYDAEMFNFALNVNSRYGYDNDADDGDDVDTTESNFIGDITENSSDVAPTINDDNEYNFGAVLGLTPMDMFNLEVSMATVAEKDSYSMLTVGGEISGTVMEGLTYSIPADYVTVDYDGLDDAITGLELYPNVSYSVDGITAGLGFYYLALSEYAETATWTSVDDDDDEDGEFTYGNLSDDMDYSILTFNLGYGADMYNVALAAEITLTEDSEEEDFVVTADVTPVAGAKFYTEVEYQVEAEEFGLNELGVELTSELTGIENTVFTAALVDVVVTDVDDDEDKGMFYVGVKVTL